MTAPAASPDPSTRSDRDIQRAALTDLTALAAACAAEESQIEREYRTGIEKEKQGNSDRGFQLEEKFKTEVEQTNQAHQKRKSELARQYQTDRARATAADQAGRRKLENEKQALDEKIKSKLGQALWLADSVLELASNKIAAEFKSTGERIEKTRQSLDGLEVQEAELIQHYGMALPTQTPPTPPDPQIERDADAALAAHREAIDRLIGQLRNMPTASLLVGLRPMLISLLLMVAAGAAVQLQAQSTVPQWKLLGIYVGGTLVLCVAVAIILRLVVNSRLRNIHAPLLVELALARACTEQQQINSIKKREADHAAAVMQRDNEAAAARTEMTPFSLKAARDRDTGLMAAQAEYSKLLTQTDRARDAAAVEVEQVLRKRLNELDHGRQRAEKEIIQRNQRTVEEIERRRHERSEQLLARWNSSLGEIQKPIDRDGPIALEWNDSAWKDWKPPRTFASRVRFGQMQVDLKQIAENVPQKLTLPPTFSLPALLAFPAQASLLIHTDHAGRSAALETLQMLMARLLTSLPAGRVRFTIIDPVGLGQNFAGFMHLADYDDALVGGRIWTSQDQIEQRLANLTEHMETVIQKYLRNEFATIDDYNAQAGELAEPYRFLVIADLPINFSPQAFARLTSIASSGARCGVYTLIVRDTRSPLPPGAHLDELKANGVNLVRQNDRFVWDDPVFRQLPLALDGPAPEGALTEILHKVGAGAKESKRVEVAFETIAPPQEKWWSASSTLELNFPIGRLGATRLQNLKLGRGVAQHVLIAGKTGSGKSTLLHAMITNSAMWYSPDELELYLIDFKKGVEFKTYATHLLPHARAIAVESDREFGLSVLQRLDAELARRGELFRKAGVQDLGAYRKTADPQIIPRTLLIIDEFQEFFSEDDKLAQESSLLIDRLVRQGRAFGVHVLLGSQTIGGAGGLPRSTLGQMAVRIALQTSEADSQLILGDNNSAARLLSRPGEAIYNDAGGLVEGNSPFQVAWLSDEKRDGYLTAISQKAGPYLDRFGSPIVFEGNAPADIRANAKLAAALGTAAWPGTVQAWLGEPVAIKDPTSVGFRRQSGANTLIVGQAEEQALAVMGSMMISLAAQQGQATFYVLDGTPSDSALAGTFARIKGALPQTVNVVEWRASEQAIDQIAQEVAARGATDHPGGGPIYLFIYGLQRYRQLRKQEEDYGSFSSGTDEPKKANPGKQLAEILREGPPVGVHVITWADTLVSVDRTFDRGAMREFDNRILFQMSAADSSSLIDSPAGNKLGFFRALIYSEEQGVMERFRPYALPDGKWLEQVKQRLKGRADGEIARRSA